MHHFRFGQPDTGTAVEIEVGLLARWFRAIRAAGRPRKKRRVKAARAHFPAMPQ